MGVDCEILLPSRARVGNVATVLGALAGYPVTRRDLGNGSWSARAEDVSVETIPGLAGCADIQGKAPCPVTRQRFSVMYHFEPGAREGRLMMPRSTPFWLAIGCGLVDFFGGIVVYQDCGDCEPDYQRSWLPLDEIAPSDGEPWRVFQERVEAIKPVDPKPFREFAAYDESGQWC